MVVSSTVVPAASATTAVSPMATKARATRTPLEATTTARRATATPTLQPVRPTPTPRSVRATATATLRPRATPQPTATPKPKGPSLHPGFGDVPWKAGEYSVWSITGSNLHGTAFQLYTIAGHQWIDASGLQQVQTTPALTYTLQPAHATSTLFSSRLAFDVNTYKLRRYDAIQDAPASVLHATLFGPSLDYTSYQSWAPVGCSATHTKVSINTLASGMMQDLVRTTQLLGTQHGVYSTFDPYDGHPALNAVGTYAVLGHEVLNTILGRVATTQVHFAEGGSPPVDVWYTADAAHVVVKWGQRGVFGAVLTRYERSSTRATLPLPSPRLKLGGKNVPCA